MTTTEVLSRLKKLAGNETASPAAATAVASPVASKAPAIAAKANPKWLQDLEETTDEDDSEVDSIDNDEVCESDIPDDSHREPKREEFKPTPMTAADLTGLPGSDDFARKVADMVVANLRDALNSIVLG